MNQTSLLSKGLLCGLLAVSASLSLSNNANAAVFIMNEAMNEANIVRIDESDFMAGSGLITFSEFPIGTTNPTYSPADYGGDADSPTVSFDGYFQGQSLTTDVSVDCPGATPSGCVVGMPSSPLSLDPNAPDTFIATDGANPTSPVLSGIPRFNGPVTILFDKDVAAVGLDGGSFGAVASMAITAYDRDGNPIGQVTNEGTGIEFLGLVTSDSSETIAGLQFSIFGSEPAGFAIDNLRFGTADEIDNPNPTMPEPHSALGLLALGGVFAFNKVKNSLNSK